MPCLVNAGFRLLGTLVIYFNAYVYFNAYELMALLLIDAFDIIFCYGSGCQLNKHPPIAAADVVYRVQSRAREVNVHASMLALASNDLTNIVRFTSVF